MRVVKVIAVGTIGFILGYSQWRFNHDGYSQQWKILPSPPAEVAELIPTGEPPLFIKTLDGKTYYLSYNYSEGWIQKSVPEELIYPFEVTKPCDFSFPEFSRFSNAPNDVINCVQEKTNYGDGYIKFAFIVDSTGNIWEWRHGITPKDITAMFCLPSSGLIIGLLVGFAFASMNNGKERA